MYCEDCALLLDVAKLAQHMAFRAISVKLTRWNSMLRNVTRIICERHSHAITTLAKRQLCFNRFARSKVTRCDVLVDSDNSDVK